MESEDEPTIVKVERSSIFWHSGFGASIFGGLTLFLMYVGPFVIKLAVLLAAVVAFYMV